MKTKTLLSGLFLLLLFPFGQLSAQCQAGFTASASGSLMLFNNTSTGYTAGNFTWDFGDGYYAYTYNSAGTSHSYASAGTYTVCINGYDSLSSCTSTWCDTINVPVGCNYLAATITSTSNATGCFLCDGSLTGGVSGGTAPFSYTWSNAATTATINNLCVGGYTFMVTDANGCTSVATGSVSCPQTCIAGFNASINGNSANFINTSNDTVWATFTWDFGDSNTGAGTNATHTYANPGWYSVTLYMTDSVNACTDSYNDTVVVGGPASCGASFSMMPDSANTLQWYAYPSVSGQAPFSYHWDFGDGDTSNLAFPTHTYAVAGSYNICLTITDANGCTSMHCDSAAAHRMASQMQYFTVVNVAAGIHEQDEFTGNSSPNPAGDFVNVSFNKNVSGTLRVVDLTGKIVMEQKIDGRQAKIDVSALPAGIYNLSLSGASTSWNKKVVVVHQ